jgi:hypothetical protein
MVYHLILLPCASDYCTRSSRRLKSILLSLRSISRDDPPYYLPTKAYSTSKHCLRNHKFDSHTPSLSLTIGVPVVTRSSWVPVIVRYIRDPCELLSDDLFYSTYLLHILNALEWRPVSVVSVCGRFVGRVRFLSMLSSVFHSTGHSLQKWNLI